MKDTEYHADRWWDGRLLAIWIGVNALGYVVIVVGGVVLVAVIGAAFHGLVLGRWQ